MIDRKMRQALLVESGQREDHANELEENEKGVYTEDDVKAQRQRANYLRSLAEDKGDLFLCTTCGYAARLPRFATHWKTRCPSCNAPNSFTKIAFSNGYDEPHLLNIWVRADVLEILAGKESLPKELAFAIGAADCDDADNLRWLAVLIEGRLNELDVAEAARTTAPGE